MFKHLQALTPFAFLPVLVFAEQGTVRDKTPAPVLAVVQTDASRPGDDLLDCDGLENELLSITNDPAVRSHFSGYGTNRQSVSRTRAPRSVSVVATRARITQLAKQNLQQEVKQLNELLTIAPQLTRGQRVLQLARTRNCQWLQEPERSTGHEAGH